MKPAWPDGKTFAFTVFDDADSQTVANGSPVYRFLADCGLRTTKSVWPVRGALPPSDHGECCDDPHYLAWAKSLQADGFEIGYHMAASSTSTRPQTIAALDRFRERFGHYPRAMANHYFCDENIYFGDARVSGSNRLLYNLLTRFGNRGKFRGEVEGDPLFWGDLCAQRIRYVRNFQYADINTLRACPQMPYSDPDRPYVNRWFASSEGANVNSFNQRLAEENQDRLEAEGGACIMYTHFGLGFYERGSLNTRFRDLIARLSRRNGWFVPVSTLLDHIERTRGAIALTRAERAVLERRWLVHKVRFGTT